MRVRIEDTDVVYEFDGTRIAGPVSTKFDPRKRQRARWMEATIWRKDDDAYVFEQVSYSTVWHVPAGAVHVRKPATVTAEHLPDKAVYCGVLPSRPGRGQCPPMDLEASRDRASIPDVVVIEEAQRRVWTCPDRDAVISRMTLAHHKSDGAVSAAVSGPMRELLDQAEANDPAFRGESKPVVQI